MAKLHEENVVITLTRAVKEKGEVPTLINKDLLETLENVVTELIGDAAIVEVKKV
jgi:hypothetical protein